MKGKEKKTVVVVGGQFAGREARRLLLREYNVVMIEPKDYFEYTPAILRTLVHPELVPRFLVKQPEGTIRDKVVSVSSDGQSGQVQLLSGRSMPFDYCVLCTGSSYPSPIKSTDQETTMEERGTALKNWAQRVQAASSIVVVGGGTVGVELAGELVGKYGRSKQVVLIHPQERLLERLLPDVSSYAHKWLGDQGVEVVLGEKVVDIDWNKVSSSPGPHTVVTTGGRSFTADLVFRCYGGVANTLEVRVPSEGLTAQEPVAGGEKVLDLRAGFAVEPTLQVAGFANVFACGDCMATSIEKTSFASELAGKLAARNVVQLSLGKPLFRFPEDVCDGGSMPEAALVSLSASDGVAQMVSQITVGRLAAIQKAMIQRIGCAVARENGWAIWLAGFMRGFAFKAVKQMKGKPQLQGAS